MSEQQQNNIKSKVLEARIMVTSESGGMTRTRETHNATIWHSGGVQSLDLGGGSMSIHTCKISLS